MAETFLSGSTSLLRWLPVAPSVTRGGDRSDEAITECVDDRPRDSSPVGVCGRREAEVQKNDANIILLIFNKVHCVAPHLISFAVLLGEWY